MKAKDYRRQVEQEIEALMRTPAGSLRMRQPGRLWDEQEAFTALRLALETQPA